MNEKNNNQFLIEIFFAIKPTQCLYSLGGGCFPYYDIPKEYRANSIFKAAGQGTFFNIFLPLELFNGNLENEFLNKDLNWKFKNINSNYDFDVYNANLSKDKNFISNYLIFFDIENKNNGFFMAHGPVRKENPLNKNTYRQLFKIFNDKKYNFFYIIDFHRGGYSQYTNQHLIQFEDYLQKHDFNLNNFVYFDVSNSNAKDRFMNCKIPVFIQNIDDSNGYSNKANKKEFHNTYCFLNNHKKYVEIQLERIAMHE